MFRSGSCGLLEARGGTVSVSQSKLRDKGRDAFVNPGVVDC